MGSSVTDIANFRVDQGKIDANRFLPDWFPVHPSDRLLNVGCGYGAQIVHFGPRVQTLFSTDISLKRLLQMREVLRVYPVSNNRSFVGDACRLPVQSASFDKALAIGVIHLVDKPEQLATELSRVLKPGGKALLTFPTMHYFYKGASNAVGSVLRKFTGKQKQEDVPDVERHWRSPFTWLALVEQHGFRVESFRASTLFPPLHWFGIPRFWVTNPFVRRIDSFLSGLPVLKFLGQAAIVVLVKD